MLPNSVSQFQFFHNRNSWQIFCVHLNAIGLVNQALTTTWYTFNSQFYQQTNGIARTSIFNHSWNLYAGNLLQKKLQYLRCSILQKSGNDLLMAFIPFLNVHSWKTFSILLTIFMETLTLLWRKKVIENYVSWLFIETK